jgi:dynamin GTPase
VQPTGENGATRAPIVVDLQREPGLSSKAIVLQIDSKSQQVSASELDLVAVLPASIDEFWKLGD